MPSFFDRLRAWIDSEIAKDAEGGDEDDNSGGDDSVQASKAIFKATRDEERMVYGFASVSTAKGAKVATTDDGQVIDSHKDLITTKALRSLCRGLMMGQRAGKFDHAGVKKSEIVEAVVLDADLWKAMGQYFEDTGVLPPEKAQVFKEMTFEGLLTGFHCADDEVWKLAQDSDFELSIGAERAHVQDISQ